MKRFKYLLIFFILILFSCNNPDSILIIKQIETNDELIGGPTAKGSPGDYILQNDRVRFIICGAKHSWSYGIFGGSIIDADLVYPYSQFRYDSGTDSFSETFPTANLIVPNPTSLGFEIVKDGSDGREVVLRVTGEGAFMFESLSMLSGEKEFNGISLKKILPYIKGKFSFITDYILKKGDNYITVKTTIDLPYNDDSSTDCIKFYWKQNCEFECSDADDFDQCVKDCYKPCDPYLDCSVATDKEKCEKKVAECKQKVEKYGYFKEDQCPQKCDVYGRDDKTWCKVCTCVEEQPFDYYTESKPIFVDMLGEGIPGFKNEEYKSGFIVGDFLFFGKEVNLFTPGIGFDESKTIFENLYNHIDTLTNPLAFDFVTGVANYVSYSYFVTGNPQPDKCSYEVVLTSIDFEKQKEVEDFLVDTVKVPQLRVQLGLKGLHDQGTPLVLKEDLNEDEAKKEAESVLKEASDNGITDIEVTYRVGNECRKAKVLIPLFTTSATVGIVGFKKCRYDNSDDDKCDYVKKFTFTRYFGVGEGDVASALEPYYKLNNIDTGFVEGVVLNAETGAPLSKVKVFLFHDPFDKNEDVSEYSYQQLIMANRKLLGNIGAVTEFTTDRGFDPILDGVYSGLAPTGTYIMFARSPKYGFSQLKRVKIEKDKTVTVNFKLNNSGYVDVEVYDEKMQALPCKVVAVSLDKDGNPIPHDGMRKVALGDSRYEDGIKKIFYTHTGRGKFKLEPGYYRFYVSHGFEYSIEIKDKIKIEPGQVYKLKAQLFHEVDTTGWISGDLHLHARPSFDSGLPVETRVVQCLVEGLEFISSSDHDVITDYEPYIKELKIDSKIKSQIGTELTTVETGHFLGFPLKYDYTNQPTHGAIDWVCRSIGEIFKELRSHGEFSPEETVICVPHPRSGFDGYFSQIGLSTFTLKWKPSFLEANNPVLKTVSCDFDAIELINEKRFEYVRNPSVWEIVAYNQCFNEIHSQPDCKGVAKSCEFLQNPEKCKENPDLPECAWHEVFKQSMQVALEDGLTLNECKEIGRNAINRLMIRYFLERTKEEQEWMNKFTPGTDSNCDLSKTPDATELDDDLKNQPCDKYAGPIDDWFQFFNYNFNVTGMGNSDSHGKFYEAGFPRNFIKSSTDNPALIDKREIDRNIKEHRVVMSTGPFITFHIKDADIGDTIDLSDSKKIPLYIKVQTPSWFGIDRIEIYGNGKLLKEIWVPSKVSDIVDFEDTIEIDKPDEDTWFVVIAMGLGYKNSMAPVYTSTALGKLLLPNIVSLAFSSIPLVGSFMGKPMALPDFYSVIPYAVTNPIWVITDGDGKFTTKYDRPPFCPVECTLKKDDSGMVIVDQSDCPDDLVCLDDGDGDDKGICGRNVEGECGAIIDDSGNNGENSFKPFQASKMKSPFKKYMIKYLPDNLSPKDFSRLLIKKLVHYFSPRKGQ